jgi:hypothetical protein
MERYMVVGGGWLRHWRSSGARLRRGDGDRGGPDNLWASSYPSAGLCDPGTLSLTDLQPCADSLNLETI